MEAFEGNELNSVFSLPPQGQQFQGGDHMSLNELMTRLLATRAAAISEVAVMATAVTEAKQRDSSVLPEKMSFKKRKVDKSHNLKAVAEEEDCKEKRIRGCTEEGESKITEQNNNSDNDNKNTSNNNNNKRETSADTSKENSKVSKVQKPDYIHVRARRGQATDSHSLAERFLSMKLAAVNPTLDFNIDNFVVTEVFSACTSNFPIEVLSEIANPAYLQFNPLQQVVSCSGLEMGINAPDMALRRMISAPVSSPETFLDSTQKATEPRKILCGYVVNVSTTLEPIFIGRSYVNLGIGLSPARNWTRNRAQKWAHKAQQHLFSPMED
ncbi:hypothetical protein TEA_012825 [Camellia sinensis var. sinensis]|uniref:Uncharacterized protein n=1 Tax=Camellia sinensis var. sinensis TaxID=542762 RepID=A0A4S4D2H7_CAMSN|nr:hypothetical protein TEA_012825 [Camellia sinensis var. sinensis]